MTMADDQRVYPAHIDFEEFKVVGVYVRGKSEIEQVTARLLALARLEVQRQAPLTFQRLSLRSFWSARAANNQTRRLDRSKEKVVSSIGNLANGQLIDC